MAHFMSPPDGDFGEYDIDNRLAVGSVWRMKVAISGAGSEVALWGGAGLKVRSNNPEVVGNPLPERAADGLRVLRMAGRRVGTTMVEAGMDSGPPWVSLQVQVVQELAPVGNGDSLIALTAPHMALNAADTPVPYRMKYTHTIPIGLSAANIASLIGRAGHLKHLAFSCHGHIVYDKGAIQDSEINLGGGLNSRNMDVFDKFKPVLKGGVLWFGACGIGNDDVRNRERAVRSGCYVVAPVMYMQSKTGHRRPPPGQIDMFQRFTPKVFTPAGELMGWGSFLRLGSKLGFGVA